MDPEDDMKCALRRLVTESRNALTYPEEPYKVENALCKMLNLLAYKNNGDPFPLPSSNYKPSKVQAEFIKSHYSHWLECLIDKFSVDWLKHMSPGKVATLVDVFFLEGSHEEAFMVLSEAVDKSR